MEASHSIVPYPFLRIKSNGVLVDIGYFILFFGAQFGIGFLLSFLANKKKKEVKQ